MRTALRVLALADTYAPARLEAACVRGCTFGDTSLGTLKRVLAEDLDQLALPLPIPAPTEGELVFARPPAELAEAILGGAAWN